MSDHNPYPRNAPGPFYVGDAECISCGAPEAEAPDLIEFDEASHCYFRRQPATALEVERAIRAIRVACCGAVRYAGQDPTILARIHETDEKRRERWREQYGHPDILPATDVPPRAT